MTSKLWMQDYGCEAAKKGIDDSLKKLGLKYMDLYLLHQPYGDTAGAWKALEELRKYLDQYGIRLEAWYPLGHADKALLTDERLVKVTEKYGKSVVQVVLC